MATTTVYASSAVTSGNTWANYDNAVGSSTSTWAGPSGTTGDDPAGRWLIADPNLSGGSLTSTQTINVWARKSDTGGGDPDLSIVLYENGSSVATLTSATITSETGAAVQGTFDASAITNPNNVEIHLVGTSAGGGPNSRSVQVAYIEWVAQYVSTVNATATPSTVAGSAAVPAPTVTAISPALVRYNTAEGGTADVQCTNGSGGNTATSGDFFGQIDPTSPTAAVTFAAVPHTGSLSYKLTQTGTTQTRLGMTAMNSDLAQYNGGSGEAYIRFAVRWTGFGATTDVRFFQMQNNAYERQFSAFVKTDGTLRFAQGDDTSLWGASTYAMSTNTWYQLVFRVVESTTGAWSAEIRSADGETLHDSQSSGGGSGGVAPSHYWPGTGVTNGTAITTGTQGTGNTPWYAVSSDPAALNTDIEFSYTGTQEVVEWRPTPSDNMLWTCEFVCPAAQATRVPHVEILDQDGLKLGQSAINTSRQIRLTDSSDGAVATGTVALTQGTRYILHGRWTKGASTNTHRVYVYSADGTQLIDTITASSITQNGTDNRMGRIKFGVPWFSGSVTEVMGEFAVATGTSGETTEIIGTRPGDFWRTATDGFDNFLLGPQGVENLPTMYVDNLFIANSYDWVQTDGILTPSAVAATASLPTPTVTTGSGTNAEATPSVVSGTAAVSSVSPATGCAVAASTITGTAAAPAVSVSAGTALTASSVDVTSTASAPSVSAGVDVTAGVVAGAVAVPSSSLSAGSEISAADVSAVAVLPAPSVPASATISPSPPAASVVLPAPAVSGGVTVEVDAVSAVGALPAATVFTGVGAAITAGVVTSTAGVPTPAVQTGSAISVDVVPAAGAVISAVVSAGVGITTSAVDRAASLPAPAVGTGAAVTSAGVAGTAALPTPSVLTGSSSNATPSSVVATAALPAPGILTASNATPSTIVATAALPVPSVLTASTATGSVVAATAGLPVPSVTTTSGAEATPGTVTVTAALPLPTVLAGSSSNAAPPVVAATATLPGPSVLTSSAVAPSVVVATAALPGPSVTTTDGAVATPATVAATASIPSVTMSGGTTIAASTVVSSVSLPSVTVSASVTVTVSAAAASSSLPTPAMSTGVSLSPVTVAAVGSVPEPVVTGYTTVEDSQDFDWEVMAEAAKNLSLLWSVDGWVQDSQVFSWGVEALEGPASSGRFPRILRSQTSMPYRVGLKTPVHTSTKARIKRQ